jgi:hypothetical protein
MLCDDKYQSKTSHDTVLQPIFMAKVKYKKFWENKDICKSFSYYFMC